MKTFKYDCPSCGANKIEVVENDAIAVTPILGYDEISGEPVFDLKNTEVPECFGERRYQCQVCGFVITTGDDDAFMDKMASNGAASIAGKGE